MAVLPLDPDKVFVGKELLCSGYCRSFLGSIRMEDIVAIIKNYAMSEYKHNISIRGWFVGSIYKKQGDVTYRYGYNSRNGMMVSLCFIPAESISDEFNLIVDKLIKINHPYVTKLIEIHYDVEDCFVVVHQYSEYVFKLPPTRNLIMLVFEYNQCEWMDIYQYKKSPEYDIKESIIRTHFKQLLDAVETCHKCGLVIKYPTLEDIYVDSNCNIKLSGFGLQYAIKSATVK